MVQSLPQTASGAKETEFPALGLAPADRRALGAYFTPAAVVKRALDLCEPLLPKKGPLCIVDPACGDGAFLEEAARRHARATLLGLELHRPTARLCQTRVPGAHIRHGDALRGDFHRLSSQVPEGGFELWVGNPPYNGTSIVLKNDRVYRALQRLLPPEVPLPKRTSLRDDFAFFLLRVGRRLKDRPGALAFVTSASVLDNFLYAPVREAMLSWLRLVHVVDLGKGIFPGTRVHTCITVWIHSKGDSRPALFHPRTGSTPEIFFHPRRPEWKLLPESDEAETLDRTWLAQGERIGTLIPVSFPGLKTRFDELLVDLCADALLARVAEFLQCPTKHLMAFAKKHGLPSSTWAKLRQLKQTAEQLQIKPDPRCIRPYFRYAGARHRTGIPASARAFCYLERRLIPRGDHRFRGAFDPHQCSTKLLFNVRELPLGAAVLEAPGCVHNHQHTRFAPLWIPRRIRDCGLNVTKKEASWGEPVLNLSARGLAWAKKVRDPSGVFARIAEFVNSEQVQNVWAPALGKTRELPIPVDSFISDGRPDRFPHPFVFWG